MTVSRISPFIAPALLLLLLAGCADVPLQPIPHRTPDTPAKPVARPPVSADLPPAPVLPAAGSGRGGYYKDDGPGDTPPPKLDEIPDAIVRAEPYSRYANRPYVVFGKTYTPMLNEQPFVQRGMGSWYGKKFHGQRTSSGEIYDMYKMTAAHPTLPIPSYARVTDIASGKQVVVRINDRGPFHASRIVDLSYTAAVKLGMLERGSHNLLLERLLPNGAATRLASAKPAAPEPEEAQGGPLAARAEINELIVENQAEIKAVKALPDEPEGGAAGPAPVVAALAGFYVQMGAFMRADKADEIRARVAGQGWSGSALGVVRAGVLHKVLAGPFATRDLALEAARGIPVTLGLRPIVVKR
ncbi:MAG: septal ring lytic transglycosylase RlpA family protein [Pseudomonadota bacterium]